MNRLPVIRIAVPVLSVLAILALWTVRADAEDKPETKANTSAKAGRDAADGKNSAKEQAERSPAAAAKRQPLELDELAVLELEERERRIEEKEKQLEERMQAVAVQEKVLQNKLKRIQEITQKIAERLDNFQKASTGKVEKLVTVIEKMKSGEAAKFFENMDPYLAVAVLARIDVQRAAKIMNQMDKEISAKLSELYTGYRSRMENGSKDMQPKG